MAQAPPAFGFKVGAEDVALGAWDLGGSGNVVKGLEFRVLASPRQKAATGCYLCSQPHRAWMTTDRP